MRMPRKPLVPYYEVPVWMLTLLAAFLAVAVIAAIELKSQYDQSVMVKQQIGRIQESPRPKPQPSAINVQRNEQWAKLRMERSFSWYPLFVAIEQAAGEEVELLDFFPDKANRQLTLRGEARDLGALAKYMARLSAQPAIGQVYLSHQKKLARDSLEVISFEMRASIAASNTAQ